jgi:hypothetical protein
MQMSIENEELKEPEFEVAEGVDLESTEVEHEQEEAEAEIKMVAEESELKAEEIPDVNGEADADAEVKAYSKKVQKRIQKLTGKLRESERREQAAIQYAQGVQSELNEQKTRAHQQDNTLFGEYNTRIDTELDQAKSALRQAYEGGDPDAIVDASQALARLSVEQENLKRVKAQREQAPAPQPKQIPREFQQQPPKAPAPDPKAEQWAEDNDWFGNDDVMTSAALVIHRKLVEKGVDTNSELYYTSLNKELKKNFPNRFTPIEENSNTNNSYSPRQTVAGARRTVGNSSNHNKVKLTQSQISIANRLGVPLEQYAKQVQRIQS